MGLHNYIVGLVLGAAALGPVAYGARRLRTRLVPTWSGAPAAVAETVIALSVILLALEAVGILGVLTRAGAVCACAAGGGLTALAARTLPARRQRAAGRASGRGARGPTTFALLALAIVAAPWIGWTVFAYRHGMQTIDSIWYHLPAAARFAQTGSILHLQYFDNDPVTVFYPENAEMFHALGLVLFRSDLLSPLINLGWGALALVAAWAIGARYRRGPHCLLGVLLVLATPGLIDTQPGGAYNDVTCIALLLAAAAVLVNGGLRAGPSALAAAACGVAVGTKFTMIVPVVALGIGVVAITRAGRARQAGVWVLALILLGGYWYGRNAAIVGNPVPSLSAHLGPISLPAPHVSTPTYTVAQYLTDSSVWRHLFLPGLRESFGPAWWAMAVLAILGALAALLNGRALVFRVLGAVAIIGAVAYVLTPQFLGLPGLPIFFVYNLRYVAPAVALALALVPMHPVFRHRGPAWAWLGLCGAVLVATEIDPGVWATGLHYKPFSPPLHGGPAVAGVAIAAVLALAAAARLWLPLRALNARHLRASAVTLACAVTGVGGWFVADAYARDRYRDSPPLPAIYNWARTVRHSRIGDVGVFFQYPLSGPDSSNYVQYMGQIERHAGYGPFASCASFRRAVNRGRYQWLVVAPHNAALRWSAGTAPVVRDIPPGGTAGDAYVLFRVIAPLDPNACPG